MKNFLTILIINILFYTLGFSQVRLGTPAYKTFYPLDYELHPQVWCITQLNNGYIFLGTYQGSTLYDGQSFITIMPREVSTRAVMEDTSDNRIYVGGDVAFGYLGKKENGWYKFVKLSDSLPDNLKDFVVVLGIEKQNGKIYFFGLNRIYVYRNDTLIKTIAANNSFRYSFKAGNRIFTYDMGYGLVELMDDTVNLLLGTEKFASGRINGITQLNDTTLLFTATRPVGIYKYNTRTLKIEKINTKADDFFRKSGIKNIKHLPNGKIVVGTSFGGIVVFNKDLKLEFIFNTSNGASDDEIYDFISDYQGNIWFTTNNGLSVLYTQSELNYVSLKKLGVKYLPTGSTLIDSSFYVVTLNGLYKLILETPSPQNKFLGIRPANNFELVSGQTLDILNTPDNTILTTATQGLIAIKNDKVKIISDKIMGFVLEKSFANKDIVYTTHSLGFAVLKFLNNEWRIINNIQLPVQPRYVYEYDQKNIIISALNGAIYHFRFSDTTFQNFTYKEIDLAPYHNRNIPVLFKYQDTLFSFIYEGKDTSKTYYLDIDKDTLIFWHYRVQFMNHTKTDALPGYDVNYVLKSDTVNILRSNFSPVELKISNNIIYIDDYKFRTLLSSGLTSKYYDAKHQLYWCTTPEFIFNFPNHINIQRTQKFQALINEVVLSKNDSSISFFNARPHLVLPYEFNALVFYYSAPFFQKNKPLQYSYKLEGFDKKWSKYTLSTFTKYTNLPPGDYTFMVKAKNVYGDISQPATISFTVLPPWYMTWWAYLIYVLLLVLLIIISVRLYAAKLKADNEKLEAIVKARTQELREKNKLITDSIEYAKKIQDAIIPTEKHLKRIFPDSFVIFRPRDIVSGDFFWIHQISTDKVIVAVADCTGHGVPGAFMSMIGNTLLNEIIKEHKIYQPAQILAELHKGVIDSLRNNEELSLSFDGMDIVITLIDTAQKKVTLSSASQYAFLFADNTLHTFFGDLYSIGDPLARGAQPEFETYHIQYETSLTLFFSSDGYFDQFGGNQYKKFTVSAFIAKLKEIYKLPADQQKAILWETFKQWKGNKKQIDDVIVVGINI